MSQSTSVLAKPIADEKISRRNLGYATESAREEVFDLVIRNCVESGVTKATLARRLDKDPSQISRLLGAPGNWTIDTVAELLYAIDGSLLHATSFDPRLEPLANQRFATCFDHLGKAALDIVYVAPTRDLSAADKAMRKANNLSWK